MRASACLLVFVAACQGGGEKNSAHAISLDAATTSVVAGEAGVPLSATIDGATESVTWQLSGPGALSQTTGRTTIYSPPACVTEAATAIVTASSSGANASVTFVIQPGSGSTCLTISPEGADVTVGEGPVTLTASSPAPMGEITWTLFGPGSLSATKGTSTVYTPPESVAGEEAVAVTIAASASSSAIARTMVRVNPRWSLKTAGAVRKLGFDGENVWAYLDNATLLKVRVSDGVAAGTYPFPFGAPYALLVHAGQVWIASAMWSGNTPTGQVTRVRIDDGAILGTTALGNQAPDSLAFDGRAIWFGSGGPLGRLSATDGALLEYASTDGQGVVFDGANVWAVRYGLGVLTRLRVSDGANLGNVPADGAAVQPVAYGPDLWILRNNYDSANKVWQRLFMHVQGTTGMILDVRAISDPWGVVEALVEGDYVWTRGQDHVVKRRLSDLDVQKTWVVNGVCSMVFDGVHLWVGSYNGFVTRL